MQHTTLQMEIMRPDVQLQPASLCRGDCTRAAASNAARPLSLVRVHIHHTVLHAGASMHRSEPRITGCALHGTPGCCRCS